MDNDTTIKLIQALVDDGLLLIDEGEVYATASLEVQRKTRNDGKEIVLFIVKVGG